jgi:hypothetical protein
MKTDTSKTTIRKLVMILEISVSESIFLERTNQETFPFLNTSLPKILRRKVHDSFYTYSLGQCFRKAFWQGRKRNKRSRTVNHARPLWKFFHLLQQMEFPIDEPDQTKGSLRPSPFGLGTIANHLPRLHRLRRRWHHPTGINPGNLDVITSRGPNQTQITPKAYSIL